MERVSAAVSEEDLNHMTKLYYTYLLCIITMHGVYSVQAEWMQKVGSLSRAAIRDFAVAIQGPRITACL